MPFDRIPQLAGDPPTRTPVLPAHPTSFTLPRTFASACGGDHLNQLPRLSRNIWGRSDLARLVSTEIDLAPYISVAPIRRSSGS